jgi:type II secretory pathway pseudopilin PulG
MTMRSRPGITLVEMLVALAILVMFLGLLLPAVHSARERAREAVCKNNLHQINLALAQFAETHDRLPSPASPGVIGGWMVEVLPFLEQQAIRSNITEGVSLAKVPDSLFRPPPIFLCPRRLTLDSAPPNAVMPGHYVFVPASRRRSFLVFDAPIAVSVPWLNGPEMDYAAVSRAEGPHSQGFFYASGFQQGVRFMPQQ